jgi:C-terminal processing protease CtpA/Prc
MKVKLLLPVFVLVFVIAACSFSIPRQSANTPAPTDTAVAVQVLNQPTATAGICPAPVQPGETSTEPQPVELKGSFDYSNDIIVTYYVEQEVALTDMYGFVKRDREWEIPVASQTLGYLAIDKEAKKGTYTLQLPARPSATQVDVNPDGKDEAGVQVFTVAYWPNLTGGPYSEGDDPSRGWPAYLTSARNDSENEDEVIGGKLIIWSPDAAQSFPSDFGADGKLFTQDDPVMAVPQGYSIIDLDKKPFAILRDEEPDLTLYEPNDVAIKDFSAQSYTEAFDNMFKIVSKEYAFNGIEAKQPNWDKVYADLSPRVKEAEQKKDPMEFYLVMRDFITAFKDGHVGLNGGQMDNQYFTEKTAGGYGFAIRELDDGRAIIVFVLSGGPADKAGMKKGAEVTEFDGKPIKDAIAGVKPLSAPHSTDFSLRYQQARYLLRAAEGTKASVSFANPKESAKTVDLLAVAERQSFSATSTFRGFDSTALPVEHVVLPQGIGYIKISSNYDDLNLIIRLFQRALQTFTDNQIDTVIIDMRQNSGGAPLGLAGFLTSNEITLGQLQYYSDKTGKFENEGLPEKVTPNIEQYSFKKMFLMVDQACASACELEAYGFSQVPGMVVVGQYPSSGTEAEVARGQFLLPEGMSLQIPTGRFVLPDGSIFLEGKGVQPTKRIPITEDLVLADGDPVLSYVIQLAQK